MRAPQTGVKMGCMNNESSAKKSLGQHWLRDEASLRAICAAAEVSPGNTVLEIGPGLGTLTLVLVQQAQKVIAVELDESLARELPARVTANNLQVINQDILQFDFTQLSGGYKVVANIPYYLTSNLIRMLSELANPPAVAALLVQKEVAERVAARPGSMSLLSVTAQFYWRVSLGQIVPAGLFMPPPKVDSQILIMKRREALLFPDADPKHFFRLAKAGFSQRRKTLLNSLSAGLQLDRKKVESILKKADIPPTTRAQALSLEQWYELYKNLIC